MKHTFIVPGPPQAKQRARVTRRGITYTPKETARYENLVKLAFARDFKEWVRIIKGTPVAIAMTFYFPIPASASKKLKALMMEGRVRPTKRPDWDNLGKAITDSLNGILYDDDCQVCDSRVIKIYGETVQAEIQFETIE